MKHLATGAWLKPFITLPITSISSSKVDQSPQRCEFRRNFRIKALAARQDATASSSSSANNMLAAAQKLSQRLKTAILAESEENERRMKSAYDRASEKQLIREGLILVNLTASAKGRLYGDIVYKLESSRPFPSDHKFRPGNAIHVQQQTNSSSVIEATVLEAFPSYILITLSPMQQQADSSRGMSTFLSTSKPSSLRVLLQSRDTAAKRQLLSLDKLLDISLLSSASEEEEESSDTKKVRRSRAIVRAALLGSAKGVKLAAEPPEWMSDTAMQIEARNAIKDLGELNVSQKTAIAAALTRTFTLWQGPPGTGKTKTALAYLKVVCKILAHRQMRSRGRRITPILAVAETNNAADNLLEGLYAADIRVVRIGQAAKIRPALRKCSLEDLAENSRGGQQASYLRDSAADLVLRVEQALKENRVDQREMERTQQEARRMWKQADMDLRETEDDILRSAQVIVATCSGAGDGRLSNWEFPIVVIDESTQATEAATLVPLVLGAESVVMAGDPAQLWPVVMSQKARQAGLDIPLFARLQKECGMPALLLNVQYRMHPLLSRFSSIAFYNNKIVNGVDAKERPAIRGKMWETSPLVFFDCSGEEQQSQIGISAAISGENQSYSNPEQADMALALAEEVLKDDSVQSCAVLTPYNGQVKLLTNILKKKNAADSPSAQLVSHAVDSGRLIIGTVDGFQGREADCVILSTVRCNAKGNLGFVDEERRMNVAMTRARRGFAVIGCKKTLQTNKYWSAWMKLAHCFSSS